MKKEFKGNNEAGKGSKRRKEDFQKVQEHWDEVNGFRPSKFPTNPKKKYDSTKTGTSPTIVRHHSNQRRSV